MKVLSKVTVQGVLIELTPEEAAVLTSVLGRLPVVNEDSVTAETLRRMYYALSDDWGLFGKYTNQVDDVTTISRDISRILNKIRKVT